MHVFHSAMTLWALIIFRCVETLNIPSIQLSNKVKYHLTMFAYIHVTCLDDDHLSLLETRIERCIFIGDYSINRHEFSVENR